MKSKAMPKESVKSWKKVEVKDNGELLVQIGAFSEFSDCDTGAVYFGERGTGNKMNFLGHAVNRKQSLITHFVRTGVLEKLFIAQSLLPKNHYFRFFDNYRPLKVQQALFDAQKEVFKLANPSWDEDKLDDETQKYVSLPSPNKDLGTEHPLTSCYWWSC